MKDRMKRSASRINYRDPESNSACIFDTMGEWTKVLNKIQGVISLPSLDSHGAGLDRDRICSQPLQPVFPSIKREQIALAHSRHRPIGLVWGDFGWIGRGRHPQFRPATLSTHS